MLSYLAHVRFARLIFISFFLTLTAHAQEAATKTDIKAILQQMDKRFEQMEKRFDQIDKRFDDLKYYMTGIIAIATAILGYLILRVMRQEEKVNRLEAHRIDARDIASALFIADAEMKKKLREALKG